MAPSTRSFPIASRRAHSWSRRDRRKGGHDHARASRAISERSLDRARPSWLLNLNRQGQRHAPFKRKSANRSSSTTEPYPGFPTDMQAQMCALLSTTDGISVDHGEHFPAALHACRGTEAHGREYRSLGPDRHHQGRRKAERRARDGERSARLRRAGAGGTEGGGSPK